MVERANGILQQRLRKWKEYTERNDWSYELHLMILSMNNSICRSHKKTPYEFIYGDKSCENCSLIEKLFAKGIYDKEKVLETIKIVDLDDQIQNLNEDFIIEKNWLSKNIIFFLFNLMF